MADKTLAFREEASEKLLRGENALNELAARIFTECADVLRLQKANPFRVNAYVRAAGTLRSLETDVSDILNREGIEGLMKLPGIGKGLAAAIDEIVRTGRLSQFDSLRGESSPEILFQSLPGRWYQLFQWLMGNPLKNKTKQVKDFFLSLS